MSKQKNNVFFKKTTSCLSMLKLRY